MKTSAPSIRFLITVLLFSFATSNPGNSSPALAQTKKEKEPEKKQTSHEIKITSPKDKFILTSGTIIKATGTSNLKNTPMRLLIINEYGVPNGHGELEYVSKFETDEEGNWEDPREIAVYGPGTWSVEIEVISQKKVKAKITGDVSNP